MDREKKIIRTSMLGIGVNLVLVAFKAAVGWISGSIAVILDAVNNLSDALSSVITIVGTKLAGRAPDREHPFGHGRVEYLTSVLIAVIVLLAGAASLRESVGKILSPTRAEYSVWSLVIIVAAVGAKFFMGRYVRRVGKKINSGALTASGSDALFDAILSMGTLAAAAISLIWGLSLEGVFGALISLFILRAGAGMIRDAIVSIIGERADSQVTEALREKILSYPQVRGVYDMTLHNYGPTHIIGSVHIEVPDDMTARELHKLSRTISADVYASYGIVLTVGIYASNNSAPEAEAMKKVLSDIVKAYPGVLQVHGFYLDTETRSVTFDLTVTFKADSQAIREDILAKMEEKYPGYRFFIVLDQDFGD